MLLFACSNFKHWIREKTKREILKGLFARRSTNIFTFRIDNSNWIPETNINKYKI